MTEDGRQRTENERRKLFFRSLSFVLCLLIKSYRYSLAYVLGGQCRFTPSCSAYALEAIECYGPFRGAQLTVSRLCRCHPWGGHGLDLVPGIRDQDSGAGQ